MRRLFYLFATSLLLCSFSGTESDIIGYWAKIASSPGPDVMIFDNDGYAYFIIDGKKTGGKLFTAGDQTLTMVYRTNSAVRPASLDITILVKGSNAAVKSLVGIYEITDSKLLKICFNSDKSGKRPVDFSPESEVLLLSKQDDK